MLKKYINTKEGKQLLGLIISSLIIYNFSPLIGIIFPKTAGIAFFFLDLIIINPLYIAVICLILTEMNGFNYKLPILVSLLFLPSVFIFYNYTALVYILLYIGLGFIFSGIGHIIHKRVKK